MVGPYGHKSTDRNLIHYKHIVEKGMWDASAKDWCIKSLGFFEQGDREIMDLSPKVIIKLLLSKISFLFFGYTIARLRKKIRIFN